MRIVAIEPIVVEVPLKTPAHGVHGTIRSQRSALVRVVTDSAVEGWGNVDPVDGYSTISVDEVASTVRRLTPALLGTDAINIQRALARMEGVVEGKLEAKAAIEMALLDAAGRALGVPVTTLLGGRLRDEVHFNAWIGTVPPAQAAREATEWVTRGFRSAKIKLDGGTDEGVERVAAVRAAVGDRLALRVDFNESLTPAEAAPFIRRLEPYALTLVEQPIRRDRIAGLAEIRREIGIPLMADESVTDPASLVEIIRREAADLVKVKVMKQGGFLRTKAMIDCAAAAGLRVVIGHGFGLTPSTLAEAALAAVSEAVVDGCEAVGPLKMAGDVVTEPACLDTGTIRLGDAAGLGVVIDHEALERYRVDVRTRAASLACFIHERAHPGSRRARNRL
ncbi:MAG TPA: enolase C-terminal domain-like protein [Methylomirabilota bacterium]|nr:enolase C-terminal domain-like protein [Methylomirabilota bacterium]